MSTDTNISRMARQLQKTLITIRRDIHQHPELGFKEHRTQKTITRILTSLGLDRVRERMGRTGVVGILHGGQRGGSVVALRADMDALPITEVTPVPYRSIHPGVMHACGHDGHVAACLGAAMMAQSALLFLEQGGIPQTSKPRKGTRAACRVSSPPSGYR